MADDAVTDLEIAVLCDLLDGPGVNLKAHKKSVLDALVSKGLVGPAKDDPERFRLTDKAHHLLAERGRGNKRGLVISFESGGEAVGLGHARKRASACNIRR